MGNAIKAILSCTSKLVLLSFIECFCQLLLVTFIINLVVMRPNSRSVFDFVVSSSFLLHISLTFIISFEEIT